MGNLYKDHPREPDAKNDTENLKNHNLSLCPHLFSQYMGVPPGSGVVVFSLINQFLTINIFLTRRLKRNDSNNN